MTIREASGRDRELLHVVADLSLRGRRWVTASETYEVLERSVVADLNRLRREGMAEVSLADNGGWKLTSKGYAAMSGEFS